MKRAILAALVSLSLLLSFAGCKSTLGEAMRESIRRAEVHTFELSELFSEKDGYHFPGYTWGQPFSAFQAAADFPISEISGYAEDGILYDAHEWHYQFGEFVNDDASVATGSDESVQLVVFGFVSSGNVPNAEQFENYAKTIEEALGTAPVIEEREDKEDAVARWFKTYKWSYVLPDGKDTSLQWGGSGVVGSKNPSAVTFSLSTTVPGETK